MMVTGVRNFKPIYLALAILGSLLPWYWLVEYLIENGLDLTRTLSLLFSNRISTFFAVDLIVSAVVVLVFIAEQRLMGRLRLWGLPVLATLLVGVSAGLPLLLFLLEDQPAVDNPGDAINSQ